MTEMKAVINLRIEVPLDVQTDELELQNVAPNTMDRAADKPYAQEAVNEKQVLKQRRDAAKEADALLKQVKKDHGAVDAYVVEVVEA